MIKVLRIINRFNLGGPTYNATFLSAFLSEEFETKLIGGKHEVHEGESVFIPEKYNVDYEIVPELQRNIHLLSDRKALKAIRKIIREYRPDIVHTHASKAGALGRIAAKKEKVPVIVHTFHGHVFHSYFGRVKTLVYKNVERHFAKWSDAIIAISPLQKTELVNKYQIASNEKVRTIPLGFDLEKFRTDRELKRKKFRKKYSLDPETVAIGIIGRLTPIKDHRWFFQVISQISDKTDKPFKVFVVGDGELMNELKEMSAEIEAKSGKKLFVFTSWIKEIDQILPGLDIVALSSLNEGTPVSLIEAQAAGVPVISTDVGGVRDVVKDGETGFVVEKTDQEKYLNLMQQLLRDKDLRKKMTQNSWNHVHEKYHYKRLCRDMEELYTELLNKKAQCK